MMKKLWPIIWVLVGIALILFVMVPLAFIAIGRIANPFPVDPVSTANLSNTSGRRGMREAQAENPKKKLNCALPAQSLEPHTRDAHLYRDGNASQIKSDFYKFVMNLEGPVVDWQYTNGSLNDEVASFVYKDVIVNMLARTTKLECADQSTKLYNDFHTSGKGVEYFSSRAYTNLGKPIGLTKSVFRNNGEASIAKHDYHWYLLDEQFDGRSEAPITTIWYSTRIGRIEYWFAFRTLKANENFLNGTAEEIIKGIDFLYI